MKRHRSALKLLAVLAISILASFGTTAPTSAAVLCSPTQYAICHEEASVPVLCWNRYGQSACFYNVCTANCYGYYLCEDFLSCS